MATPCTPHSPNARPQPAIVDRCAAPAATRFVAWIHRLAAWCVRIATTQPYSRTRRAIVALAAASEVACMKILSLTIIGLAAIGLTMLTASTHATSSAEAVARDARSQIEQVIARFQTAIIKKDKAGLSELFLPANNSWIAVPTEATWRIVHAKHPKARRFMPGSYTEFVDFIATSPEPMEEKFSNVQIATDGAVASVYFDFVFLANGKPQNRGSETWQLINTGSGWKINALVYSINVDAAQVN
jgi:hypothetical protein